MNEVILNKEIQEFIEVNLREDITRLILSKPMFEAVDNKELAEQIISKLKAKIKLPSWFNTERIFYPTKLSIEQTSSEETARYKSTLIHGDSLIDLTGGFGVDDYYFSNQFKSVIHCEINEDLSRIAAHNFKQLEVVNCQCLAVDGMEFLQQSNQQFDWIYIDPSRRSEVKGKVFLMKDCLPNVPENLHELLHKSPRILMKTSPLIDLTKGLSELHSVKEIHVVALHNEVKELLWVIEKDYREEVGITTVNLLPGSRQKFHFLLEEESTSKADFSIPQQYLYEPNSAILKSGGFNQVAIQHGVGKLHKHSHLYTSEKKMDFPGRVFYIEEVLPYQSKLIKKKFGGEKANITIRNFPKKVDEIRKTFGIKDGGERYLFFTTNLNQEKVCLVCRKD